MTLPPHENADPREDEAVIGPSNRSFGLVFATVFLVVSVWPLVRGGELRVWGLAVAAVFLTAALLQPSLLSPLNAVWLRLGLVMHRVMNPLVMAVLFYAVVTPFALVLRLAGKKFDARSGPDATASSYWIDRRGGRTSRMDQQF
jgi:hypothetical protein